LTVFRPTNPASISLLASLGLVTSLVFSSILSPPYRFANCVSSLS
jgi:hypothetical protein